VCHEQPPGQALLDLPVRIGQRSLASLPDEQVYVAQERGSKGPAFRESLAQGIRGYALAMSFDLHERVHGRTLQAQDDRDAGHALTPQPFADGQN
jgi:hypothetical protein